jgi:hypothetical protein
LSPVDPKSALGPISSRKKRKERREREGPQTSYKTSRGIVGRILRSFFLREGFPDAFEVVLPAGLVSDVAAVLRRFELEAVGTLRPSIIFSTCEASGRFKTYRYYPPRWYLRRPRRPASHAFV